MNGPFVSIIIPVYQDWERLDLCLQAINQQDYPLEKIEVIVVNNEITKYYPLLKIRLNVKLRLINESSKGSYAARNKGISIAEGEVLAFTDSDCIPDPKWITNGVKGLTQNISLLAGEIQFFCINNSPNVFEVLDSLSNLNQRLYAKIGFGATANLFIKKQIISSVGTFDPGLISSGDYEFGLRASKAGYKIGYVHDALVYHPARDTLKAIIRKTRRIATGHKLLLNRHQLKAIRINWQSFMPAMVKFSNRKYNIWFMIKLLLVLNMNKYCYLYYRIFHLNFNTHAGKPEP